MVITYANYLAKQGHDVALYTNIKNTLFFISPKVKIKKIPFPGKLGTILWALLHRVKADIIVADIIVLAIILSIKHRKKVVYFAQDYDVSYYPDKLRQKIIELIYLIGLKLFKLPCIAVSDTLKEELKPYEKRITVIYNGIDPNVFYPDPDPGLLTQKANRKAILIFGRKDPRKGLDMALKVLSNLTKKIDPQTLEVWVVGSKIVEDILPCKVRNFGYVDENKLRKILSSADVFFYPSRHEGLPLFVLETLACRCPVVTTKAVGMLSNLNGVFASNINDEKALTLDLLNILAQPDKFHNLNNKNLFLTKFNLDKQKRLFEFHLLKMAGLVNE